MTAARHDFVIEQGATWRRVIEYQNPDGTAFVLTGWTARMQVRQRHTSADPPLLALVPVVDGPAGSVTVVVTAAQTAALPAGGAVYDIELVAPSGDVTRLIEGSILVSAEVTRVVVAP